MAVPNYQKPDVLSSVSIPGVAAISASVACFAPRAAHFDHALGDRVRDLDFLFVLRGGPRSRQYAVQVQPTPLAPLGPSAHSIGYGNKFGINVCALGL
jgi:hypothetical protein